MKGITYFSHHKVEIPNTTTAKYSLSSALVKQLAKCPLYTGQELGERDAVFYPADGTCYIVRPIVNHDDSDD